MTLHYLREQFSITCPLYLYFPIAIFVPHFRVRIPDSFNFLRCCFRRFSKAILNLLRSLNAKITKTEKQEQNETGTTGRIPEARGLGQILTGLKRPAPDIKIPSQDKPGRVFFLTKRHFLLLYQLSYDRRLRSCQPELNRRPTLGKKLCCSRF